MPATTHIQVTESKEVLKKQLQTVDNYLKPRIKMLLYIQGGTTAVGVLCAKLGVSNPTLRNWKVKYAAGGLQRLLSEGRGGDFRSGYSQEQKQKIEQKLKDPKNGLQSYTDLQNWMEEELGVKKNYHALNKYVRRNHGASLKVGRKSHVKKDDTAVAVFKKPGRERQTY